MTMCTGVYTVRPGRRPQPVSHTSSHELCLHRRTRGTAQDRSGIPRSEEPRERGARADGDRDRLRSRGVEPDGRADGLAGPAHPRGVRRFRLQLRRTRHRPGGDGSRPAGRTVLLVRRAGGQHVAAEWRRHGEEDVPARNRQWRNQGDAGVHGAVGQVGRGRHHDGGDWFR